MEATEDQIETLRLLKAFMQIVDPVRRREIIELVEALAEQRDQEEPSS